VDEKKLRFHRSSVHPLISILLPYLFLFATDAMLRRIVLDQFIPAAPTGFWILMLAVGIAEAALANVLFRQRIGGLLPRLRELLLILVLSLVLLMTLKRYVAGGDFNPVKPEILYCLSLVLVQWVLSFVVHLAFRQREILLASVVGVAPQDLQAKVRGMAAEEQVLERRLGGVKKLLLFFQVAVLFLCLFAAGQAGRLDPVLVTLTAVHLGVGILFLVLINGFLDEQLHQAEGIELSRTLLRRRFLAFLAIVAAAILLVVPLVGKKSLLPPTFISNLYYSLVPDLTTRIAQQVEAAEQKKKAEEEGPSGLQIEKPNLEGLQGTQKASPLLTRLAKIAGFTLLGILGAAVLYFAARPLFSRDVWTQIRNAHPLRMLKRKILDALARIRGAFGQFLLFLRSPRKSMRASLRAGMARIRGDAGARAQERESARAMTRGRKRQLDQVVRDFVRLVRWGEKKGVRFDKAIAPMDYVASLGKTLPQTKELLDEVGLLFEEIVYSNHQVGEPAQSSYSRSMRKILRSGG
jgi:hypothetical protein